MRYSSLTIASLAALLPAVNALTITSPAPGTNIDPSQTILITWTSNGGDPSVIDLKIDNANPNELSTDQVLTTGVSTSSGSFKIPAYTIQNIGTGYQIQALSAGNTIAQSTDLTLGANPDQVSTASNGQLTLVSVTTAAATSADGVTGAATTTGAVSGTTAATGSFTLLSGTVTGTATVTDSSSSTGFVTRSTSRSSSEASAAATTNAMSTANGQMRLGGELVLSAAGVLAGVVALLA